MGLFWDLIQQNQISKQAQQAQTLEARMAMLEQQVSDMRRTLYTVIERLEQNLHVDLDQDGKIG